MTVDEMVARESIRHTINSYNMAGDSRRNEEFAAQFADDAILEFAGFPPLDGFRHEGKEAIAASTARWKQTSPSDDPSRRASFVRHNLTTCLIEVTGPDTAKARTYFVVFTDVGPDHAGTYNDELVKVGDRWLFRHRKIRLDWRSPNSIYPAVAAAARES